MKAAVAKVVMLVVSAHCACAPDTRARPASEVARAASEATGRAVLPGMDVAGVVEAAAAQNSDYRVLGFCGPRGALNVRGLGGDGGLVAWRGSPSGGDNPQYFHFTNRSTLATALRSDLLSDGPCSGLYIGFVGRESWRFEAILNGQGLVTAVKPTQRW